MQLNPNIDYASIYLKDYFTEIILEIVAGFNQSTTMRQDPREQAIKAVICGGSALSYYLEPNQAIATNDFDIRFLSVNRDYQDDSDVPYNNLLYTLRNNVSAIMTTQINAYINQPERLAQLNQVLHHLFKCRVIPFADNVQPAVYLKRVTNEPNLITNLLDSLILNILNESGMTVVNLVDLSVHESSRNVGQFEQRPMIEREADYNQTGHPGGYFKWHLSVNPEFQTIVQSSQNANIYVASLGFIFWDTIRMLNNGLTYWMRPREQDDVNGRVANKFNRYLQKYLLLLKALNQPELLSCDSPPVRRLIQKCAVPHQEKNIIDTFKTPPSIMNPALENDPIASAIASPATVSAIHTYFQAQQQAHQQAYFQAQQQPFQAQGGFGNVFENFPRPQ